MHSEQSAGLGADYEGLLGAAGEQLRLGNDHRVYRPIERVAGTPFARWSVPGDAAMCRAANDRLLRQRAIYLQPRNDTTVPKGTERLRITPTPFHWWKEIVELADGLCETWDSLGLRRMSKACREYSPAGDAAAHNTGSNEARSQ